MFSFLVRPGGSGSFGRFRSSPLCVALPGVVLVVIIFWAARVMAQANTGTAAATPPVVDAGPTRPRQEVFSLILHNIDPVSITIGVLSVCGLTLILQGFMRARANVIMPPSSTNAIRELVSQKKFKELIDFTETDPSFVSKVLNPALKRAPSFSSMKEAMETAIGENTAEEFRRIEYLNIIGNLGPLLGLLGTVLGMIDAFQAMQASGGQANPAQLADGVSKALCHTFLGLMLAVPCLASFGVLRTLVDKLTVRGALVSEELLLMIKPTDPARAGPGAPGGIGGVSGTGSRPGAMPQPGFRKPPPMPPMPSPEPSPAPIT